MPTAARCLARPSPWAPVRPPRGRHRGHGRGERRRDRHQGLSNLAPGIDRSARATLSPAPDLRPPLDPVGIVARSPRLASGGARGRLAGRPRRRRRPGNVSGPGVGRGRSEARTTGTSGSDHLLVVLLASSPRPKTGIADDVPVEVTSAWKTCPAKRGPFGPSGPFDPRCGLPAPSRPSEGRGTRLAPLTLQAVLLPGLPGGEPEGG